MAIPFDPDEIVRAIGEAIRDDVNAVGTEFARIVVPASPVDTGHFRRNWFASIGAPSGQELPGVDKSGQSTINNIRSRLHGSKRNPFTPVFIENNTPYGPRLNDGWSRQAPAMFVEAALAAALRVGPRRSNI